MGAYRNLTYPDWGLIAAVTAGMISWQLSIGDSFTSKVTSAVLAGGLSLAIGMRIACWYRAP
jgi:hypothetical protein